MPRRRNIPNAPLLAHLVCRAARLALLTASLGVLSGCQAIVDSTPQPRVRMIHATPDAPALDIYDSSTALAYNLGFGTLTSYIPLTSGNHTIAAATAGSKQTLISSRTTFASAAQYTILLGGATGSLQQLILPDQAQPAPAGQVSLRILDQAARPGAVDIYLIPAGQKLATLTPFLTGVAFNTNTGYLDIPNGAYTLVIVPAGTLPTSAAASYTGAQITYPSGSARTILLIDQQLAASSGLQVITAIDFDPATEASF